MTIGTPTRIGENNTTGSGTLSISVPVGGVPAGACILVGVFYAGGGGAIFSTPTDTAGNVYVLVSSNGGELQVWACNNCLALVSGNHITCAQGPSTGNAIMSANYTTGVVALDYNAIAQTTNSMGGSSWNPNWNTGTPQASGVVAAFVAQGGTTGNAGSSNYTQSTGWTTLNNEATTDDGSHAGQIDTAYKASVSGTPLNYNPHLGGTGGIFYGTVALIALAGSALPSQPVTFAGGNATAWNSGTTTSLAFNVSGSRIPPGSLILVPVLEAFANTAIGSVSDSAGNTYSKALASGISFTFGSHKAFFDLFYSVNSIGLNIGSTITYTFATSSSQALMGVWYAPGFGLNDSAVTANQANQSILSSGAMHSTLTSGTPTISGELFIAVTGFGNNSSGNGVEQMGYNTPSGWNTFGLGVAQTTISPDLGSWDWGISLSGLVNAGTGTEAFNCNFGSINGSLQYNAIVAGFKPKKSVSYATAVF